MTAGLEVRYLRPTPLRQPSQLHAAVSAVGESTMEVGVELWWEGKLRAEGRATWKRWLQR